MPLPMNEASSDSELQSEAVARAVRFGFAAIVFGLSYANIRCALGLHAFKHIFRDLLNQRPLPPITTFLFQAQPVLVGISFLLPALAAVLIFVGRLKHSIYMSGALILAVFFQLFFTWHALAAPLLTLIRTMQGDDSP